MLQETGEEMNANQTLFESYPQPSHPSIKLHLAPIKGYDISLTRNATPT